MNRSSRWNAARSFATYLDEHRDLYEDRNVLELGAGGALPSLVAAKNNARLVSNPVYRFQINFYEVNLAGSQHGLSRRGSH